MLRFASASPVEPQAGSWRMMDAPDPRTYLIAPPPANDSPATRAELAELRVLTARRTPGDVQQILRWSVNEPSVAIHWETLAAELIGRYRLSPPAAARVHYVLDTAIHGALIAAWHAKYQHLRPRPHQLDPRVDVRVIAVPEHPAYPSGHSTVAGAASTILARLFPADAAVTLALAQDSGMSRLKAGVHYRTDHTAGIQLGRQVAEGVLQSVVERDGGPRHYNQPPGGSRLGIAGVLALIDCQHRQCRR